MRPGGAVLGWAIAAVLPFGIRRRFDPAAARGLEAVLELRVTGAGGAAGTAFALVIASGTCAVQRRAAPEAGARLSVSARDLVGMMSGAASWPVLLAQKRLTLAGDPFLALRFPALFGLVRSRTAR